MCVVSSQLDGRSAGPQLLNPDIQIVAGATVGRIRKQLPVRPKWSGPLSKPVSSVSLVSSILGGSPFRSQPQSQDQQQ